MRWATHSPGAMARVGPPLGETVGIDLPALERFWTAVPLSQCRAYASRRLAAGPTGWHRQRSPGWARQRSAGLSGKELTCPAVMTATDEPVVANFRAGRRCG